MAEIRKGALAQLDPSLFEAFHFLACETMPLVPPGISYSKLTRVLDVGCGQHYWGKALFHSMVKEGGRDLLDDLRIEGIDNDEQVVRTANRHMRLGREQVFVSLGDWFHLPIERREWYDLVHLQLLAPYVMPSQWAPLLKEQQDACKPGGWIVWSEPTFPDLGANTPGWNQWLAWIEQTSKQVGGSPRISETMEMLLAQAGHWEWILTQTTSIPLITTGPIQADPPDAKLPDGEYERLRMRLTMLAGVMHTAGMAQDMLVQGLRTLLYELNQRRVICQWNWKTVYARKK